ncbi:hypothetical protein [Rhodococcoides fascians]|uniref:hypothetical protein n=1 Tax=Rhodococcoides fascians TaxID=1828 RepID=UPI00050C8A78|nr:hypothetical protein [Rhodococcus fascians]
MMSKIQKIYPNLRLAIYGVLAAVLGAAALFNWVTQDQADSILLNASSALGSIGFLLAAMNVNKPGAQPAQQEPIDIPALAEAVAVRVNPTIEAVSASAVDTVAAYRAQAEKALSDGIESLTGRHRAE